MNEKVENLCAVIEKEITTYKELLSLLLKERKLLTAADIENLEKNLKEQEKLFTQVDNLENQRLIILEEMSGEIFGESLENVTINDLFSRIQNSDRLNNLRTELREKVKDIIKINKSNNFLIRNGLAFIEKNIEAFFGTEEKDKLYNPKKFHQKKKQAKNLINWKI